MSGQAKKLQTTSPASSPKLRRKAGTQKFIEQQIFASEEGTDVTISKCTGVLQGECVIVTSRPDIVALVKLGSYGKGIFSRSVPCHGLMPPFTLPAKRNRSKPTSVSVDTSGVLTHNEQELLSKMKEHEERQERRMALHAQWRQEADQLATTDPPSQTLTCNPTESFTEVKNMEAIASGVPKACPVKINRAEESQDSEQDTLSFEERQELFKQKFKQLQETDQYKMDEYLQLSGEEALYLCHELKLLSVITGDTGRYLTAKELWVEFSNNKKFLAKYSAYRYYRRKGWVPKSGLKYGVDFVLYKEGPVEYHSDYAIILRLMTEEEAERPFNTQETTGDPLTWRDVIAIDRVCSSVVKELIICHVITGDGLEGVEMANLFPECIERLKIIEMLVKRWDPDKNR